MRPLCHPAVEDVTVEAILHALSDPVRVALFARIVAQDCSHNCASYTAVSTQSIPKSTLSLHFKVLRDAGLIVGERHGVEMHHTPRAMEIDFRFPGLISAIVNAHSIQVKQVNARAAAVKRAAKRIAKQAMKSA